MEKVTSEPSAQLEYKAGAAREGGAEGGRYLQVFLAIDLGIREHLRVFDAGRRADTGPSVYREMAIGGERSEHPEMGSALLASAPVQRLDGADAGLIVAANGGSDLIYAPGKGRGAGSAHGGGAGAAGLRGWDLCGREFLRRSGNDGVPGGAAVERCRSGGLEQVAEGRRLRWRSKCFYAKPGDLQSALQISDTSLQEGQGMHGGFRTGVHLEQHGCHRAGLQGEVCG